MLEYTSQHETLYQPFAFSLRGKRYEKQVFDFGLYNTVRALGEDPLSPELTAAFGVALLGKEEYEATGPHNPIELQSLAIWMMKTFFEPIRLASGEEKNVPPGTTDGSSSPT